MEDASGAAEVRKKGWLGKISLTPSGCIHSSRGSSFLGMVICSLPHSPEIIFPLNKHEAAAGYFPLEEKGHFKPLLSYLYTIISSE